MSNVYSIPIFIKSELTSNIAQQFVDMPRLCNIVKDIFFNTQPIEAGSAVCFALAKTGDVHVL